MPRNTTKTDVAVINTKLDGIKEDIGEIKAKLSKDYATKAELQRVDDKYSQTKQIVYGFIGILLIAIAGLFIGIVVVKPTL